MAENAAKAREMVAAAERNDRVLDVAFNHRNRGDVQELKKIVDAGVLGQIYYAKAGWLRREGIPDTGQLVHPAGHGRRRPADGHRRAHARHGAARARRAGGADGHGGHVRRVRPPGPRRARRREGAQDRGDRRRRSTSRTCRPRSCGWTAEPRCCSSRAGPSGFPRTSCYVTLYGSEGGASIEWVDPSAPERTMGIWTEPGAAGRRALRRCRQTEGTASACATSWTTFARPTAPATAAGRRWPAPRSSTPAMPRPTSGREVRLD